MHQHSQHPGSDFPQQCQAENVPEPASKVVGWDGWWVGMEQLLAYVALVGGCGDVAHGD